MVVNEFSQVYKQAKSFINIRYATSTDNKVRMILNESKSH